MSKFLRVFSMILIIFSLFINFYGVTFASDINMNLTENEQVESPENNVESDLSPLPDSSDIIASGVNATADEGLGLTNILSILLITIGVILILLSIAIIIRLK